EGAAACVMSYWNPIERYGTRRFARDLAQAGGTGVITPDLNPDEAGEWVGATDDADIERVFLVAPSSSDARLKVVADHTSGFIYAASMMGVTGGTADIGASARMLVSRVRGFARTPVAVGLGVSTRAQAAQIAEFADGVIVGSAYIRAIESASDSQGRLDAVATLTSELAAGTVRKG
ncbi:MAG: tryptophan synthase subunit alpha, partial [Actinobacteria bacterium]|nr:tryptophan synthase subunit alpha [Actinomycetota bacterium]